MLALDEAQTSGRQVGVSGCFVDLLTPGQWNFETPMRLEIWSAEPPDDRSEWQHQVDLDLPMPSGELCFEASGGSAPECTRVPVGDYRARVSGRGFTKLGYDGADGTDRYRLQLWRAPRASPPELRKRWPGWDAGG
jgi:hypothetical protein